jgi:hypothetical protein
MTYKIRNLGSIFIYLLIFLTTCSVSSCATGPYKAYSGEDLPSSKVSKIKFTVYRSHPLFGALESAGIQQIDNTIVFVADDPSTEVHVLPGKHDIDAYYATSGGMTIARASLWLVTEPGKIYVVKGKDVGGGKARVWIEEAETGKIVGGIKGSEDEPIN